MDMLAAGHRETARNWNQEESYFKELALVLARKSVLLKVLVNAIAILHTCQHEHAHT